MSSRLIEVFLPEAERATVETLLAEHEAAEAWYETLSQQQLWVRIFNVSDMGDEDKENGACE